MHSAVDVVIVLTMEFVKLGKKKRKEVIRVKQVAHKPNLDRVAVAKTLANIHKELESETPKSRRNDVYALGVWEGKRSILLKVTRMLGISVDFTREITK
jgi:predicted peroxiredoxin